MAASPAVLSSPRARATAAVVLLALCAAVAVLSLGAEIRVYQEATALGHDPMLEPEAVFDSAETTYQLTYLLSYAALAPTALAFLMWFHRVRVNAEVFDPSAHRRGRGWAIGGWFTPVVLLWFPRQIAGDIWRASAPVDGNGVRQRLPQTLLNLWWGAFLGHQVLERIGLRIADDSTDLAGFHRGLGLQIAASAVETVAALLAVVLVLRLTALQEARATAGPGLPPLPSGAVTPA